MFHTKIKSILSNPNDRDLLVSSALSVFVRILGALSGFLVTVVIARYLGAGDSGIYFLAFSVITFVSALSRVGLDNTVLRFVGASPALAVDTTYKSVLLVSFVSSLSALVLYFCSTYLAICIFSKPKLEVVIEYMSAGVLGLSVLTIAAMALQGLRRISASIFILNIAVNLSLIVSLFLTSEVSLEKLAVLYGLSSVLIGAFGFGLFYFFKPAAKRSTVSWRELFSSCGPLWIVVIMSQMLQWSGQFMAGAYVNSDLVAQLVVAQRIAMLTSFVLIAVSFVVAPRFATLHRNNEMAALEKLAIKSVKLTSIFALPIAGVMLVCPSLLMSFFGAEFTKGALLLQILAIGQFINAITGSVGSLLIMSGHERDLRNVTLVSGVSAILFTWVLTVQFGVVGAAVGTAIAVATQNLLGVYIVKKRLGFNTLAVWK